MNRPASSVMPGVESREQVDDLASSYLPDHEPVGSHAQRLAHQVAQGDFAGALHVGRTRLEPDHVRVVWTKLP